MKGRPSYLRIVDPERLDDYKPPAKAEEVRERWVLAYSFFMAAAIMLAAWGLAEVVL